MQDQLFLTQCNDPYSGISYVFLVFCIFLFLLLTLTGVKSQQLSWDGDLSKERQTADNFPNPMISMFSGLSLALNKEGFD